MHNQYGNGMSQGLYDPCLVKENCGFGLFAHLDGKPSHQVVQTALTGLERLTHRGAVAADGKTGDGCGLLLQKPDGFFRALAKDNAWQLSSTYAVACLFCHPDQATREVSLSLLTSQLEQHGFSVAGTRDVAVDPSVCGEHALAVLPKIIQVLINCPDNKNSLELEQQLFLVRRYTEKKLADDSYFYISSLSTQVVVYKGLVMPKNLAAFYPDLNNPKFESAIAVFHQRFSTNTLPQWRLAQPFRYLAHNGEINTIQGNRSWAIARQNKFQHEALGDIEAISPVVDQTGSDSASLDNMFELLTMGGKTVPEALRLLIPPAWQNVQTMDGDLRAFYSYHSLRMEPWDGPAGVVLTDGRMAACTVDRNGLRPARYVVTNDRHIMIASEIGVYDYPPESVVAKGRIGPGHLIAIDTVKGEMYKAAAIDSKLKQQQPYKQWNRAHVTRIDSKLMGSENTRPIIPPDFLNFYLKLFQVTREEQQEFLRILGEQAQEPTGSMGDDTPMAILSQQVRPLYDYFRQQFAQVTNPPIDPLREAMVMSLETCIGVEPNVFSEVPEDARRIVIDSPILSLSKFQQIHELNGPHYQNQCFSLYYPEADSLENAIDALCHRVEQAVRTGTVIITLSDREFTAGHLPIHAVLATGAVHQHLIRCGLRCDANIIVDTATTRTPHHFAVLLGFGATAIHPYLAFDCFREMHTRAELNCDPVQAIRHFRQGIEKSLLKIMSKMGIATVASYRGAQLFEVIGLDERLVEKCFTHTPSRISGASFEDLKQDSIQLKARAERATLPLEVGGLIKFVHNTEYHDYHPKAVMTLIQAVRTGSQALYQEFAQSINTRPVAMLRDLLAIKPCEEPLALSKVESLETILPRFESAGMSLGALSPEAHESLAMAMNRLGGRSNSGEGGEDKARFGTERNSKIKQIASGRFGVTPHYLVNAEVLQIKIAQGAKPGEGGQLPGHKVSDLIAKLRYSVPGVTLISPPPHHDIYSIEDLAQLIFDLKQVNPKALVSVKLVARPGVGTIAVGVAKAYADFITISGYDGGTAASPLSSIKFAGSPWELGLSETHQALCENDLRHKVTLQVDGGLKTGLDVIKGAILGAESFGFGTAPMVALGCKYLRICHLNNCATGVATQDEHLRKNHYIGIPEMVSHYFTWVAEEVREWLSVLGISSLEKCIGRTDLLTQIDGITNQHKQCDLSAVLFNPNKQYQQHCTTSNPPFDKGELAEKMVAELLPAIESQSGGIFHYDIVNYQRSIGARISGEIVKRYGNQGMAHAPITVRFNGVAGQSFGAWNAGGLNLILQGDANDYVGKGMTGGKIVMMPPTNSQFDCSKTTIAGNTCLYGATGGSFYAAGRVGERFAVRNSGAHAVVEGVGDHGCEYMTGGVVIVLGKVGHNFGAGMTGGFGYVLDLKKNFVDLYNHEFIDIHRVNTVAMGSHRAYLKAMIETHYEETTSSWAEEVLADFEHYIRYFWLVKPKAAELNQLLDNIRSRSS